MNAIHTPLAKEQRLHVPYASGIAREHGGPAHEIDPHQRTPILRTRSPSVPTLPSHLDRMVDFNRAPGANRLTGSGAPSRVDSLDTEKVALLPFQHILHDDFAAYPGFSAGLNSIAQGKMEDKRRNVFISPIPLELTDDMLRDAASRFGKVVCTRVDHEGGKAHAFVMFEYPDAATRFMHDLIEKGQACEYAREDWHTEYRAAEDPDSTNLYIQGLAPSDDFNFLQCLLAPAIIVSHKRLCDSQGYPRDVCMARVQSRFQRDEVIARLNGTRHPRTRQSIAVRVADSERQKALKKQRTHDMHAASVPLLQHRMSDALDVGTNPRRAVIFNEPAPVPPPAVNELNRRRQMILAQLRDLDTEIARERNAIPVELPPTPDEPYYTLPYHHRQQSSNASLEASRYGAQSYSSRFGNDRMPWTAAPAPDNQPNWPPTPKAYAGPGSLHRQESRTGYVICGDD